jgi:hypothetical protein
MMALTGREWTPEGDSGGELAIALVGNWFRQNITLFSYRSCVVGEEVEVELSISRFWIRRENKVSEHKCHVADCKHDQEVLCCVVWRKFLRWLQEVNVANASIRVDWTVD